MLLILLTILHVVVALFLIVVVLVQSGKSADIAATFGGQGSQTAFGPRGTATVFSRATSIAVVVFMLTSLTLSIMASRKSGTGRSVLGEEPAAQTETVPEQPAQESQPAPEAPKQ